MIERNGGLILLVTGAGLQPCLVLAMQGKRDDALFHRRALKGTPYVKSMRAYRESYFASLANDPELLEVIA